MFGMRHSQSVIHLSVLVVCRISAYAEQKFTTSLSSGSFSHDKYVFALIHKAK